MSLGDLNYDALLEEFCVWYFRVNRKFPNRSTMYSRKSLIRFIWKLKRTHSLLSQKEKSNEAVFI